MSSSLAVCAFKNSVTFDVGLVCLQAREVMGPSQGNRDSGLTQVERAYDALLERQQGDPEGGQEAREPFMRARLMHSRVRLLHLRGTTDDIRMSEAWAWNKRDEKVTRHRKPLSFIQMLCWGLAEAAWH